MSIKSLFPDTKPSLNLDFAKSKTVDPRITFTRASTATYYDGKTFAKAEENLLNNSQAFSNWSSSGITVTSDVEVAPDGTTTADTIIENTTTGAHAVYLTGSFSGVLKANTTFTASFYAKEGTANSAGITVRGNNSNWVSAVFNVNTGTVTTSSATLIKKYNF